MLNQNDILQRDLKWKWFLKYESQLLLLEKLFPTIKIKINKSFSFKFNNIGYMN